VAEGGRNEKEKIVETKRRKGRENRAEQERESTRGQGVKRTEIPTLHDGGWDQKKKKKKGKVLSAQEIKWQKITHPKVENKKKT